VAQRIEQGTSNPKVVGSSPTGRTAPRTRGILGRSVRAPPWVRPASKILRPSGPPPACLRAPGPTRRFRYAGPAMDSDDPLDRLAADQEWQRRTRKVDRDLAKLARRGRRGQWRRPKLTGRGGSRTRARQGVSWIFLALLAVTLTCGVALWTGAEPAALTGFGFVLAGWLVTLCVHELSHALVAHRGGDHTVAGKGYLRLDPRRYGHPVLTLVLPLVFLIAGGIPLPGAAVTVEGQRLPGRLTDSLVPAAGPAVNIAAALLLLGVAALAGPEAIYGFEEARAPFWAALTF